jgi:O-antigen/teichoic acid export membrane protein
MFAATIANLCRGAMGFAGGLVIARGLGPSGRGAFTFITNSTMLLVLLGGGGISSALTHMKAIEDRKPRELYAASGVVGLGIGLLAAGLLALGYLLISSLFRGIGGGEVVWVLALIVPLLTMSNWTAVGYLEDRVREFSLAAAVGTFTFLVAVFVLDVAGALSSASVVSVWAMTSLVPVILVARGRLVRPTRQAVGLAVRLVKFGSRVNVATVALVLTWRIDVIFVKAQRGLAELGLYAVAVGIGEIVVQLAISVRIALTPRQGSSVDRGALVDTICFASRAMTAIGALAAIGCIAVGRPVISLLYGDDFAPAANALYWLVPGVVALLVQGPLIDYLIVEGRVRGVAIATMFGLLINVAMNTVLLRDHSFVVAAVASTAAYAVSCIGCIALFCGTTHRRVRDLLVPTVADIRYVVAAVTRAPARRAG